MELILLSILVGLLIVGVTVALFVYVRKKGSSQNTTETQFKSIQEILQTTATRQEMLEKILSNQNNLLVETNKQFGSRLDNINQSVSQRLDTASKSVKNLEIEMNKVQNAATRVMDMSKDIASLQQILKAPKLRGGVGEQLLENLLAQIFTKDQYEMEYSFKNGERVDAVIKTPQGLVPIDSKFPIEAFQRLAEETNEDEKKKRQKEFFTHVKKHTDKIAEKYIRPDENTFNFALMYIPAENIYYETITSQDGQKTPANYAATKNIFPVSPNTFYIYLNTIMLGLKGMRVEKYARQIIDQMGQIRVSYNKFQSDFNVIGKHISNAMNAFEKASKKSDKIDSTLANLEQPVCDKIEDKKQILEFNPGD